MEGGNKESYCSWAAGRWRGWLREKRSGGGATAYRCRQGDASSPTLDVNSTGVGHGNNEAGMKRSRNKDFGTPLPGAPNVGIECLQDE